MCHKLMWDFFSILCAIYIWRIFFYFHLCDAIYNTHVMMTHNDDFEKSFKELDMCWRLRHMNECEKNSSDLIWPHISHMHECIRVYVCAFVYVYGKRMFQIRHPSKLSSKKTTFYFLVQRLTLVTCLLITRITASLLSNPMLEYKVWVFSNFDILEFLIMMININGADRQKKKWRISFFACFYIYVCANTCIYLRKMRIRNFLIIAHVTE